MTNIDLSILLWIQEYVRNSFLDFLMPFITSLGNYGIVWIIITLILLVHKKTRKLGFIVLFSLILDVLCCDCILKPLIHRTRPFDTYPSISLLIAKPTDYSFPSGHTASSFAVISALYFARSKWWKGSLVIGVLIALSRLYLFVHYPSDVLAGMILGICLGKLSNIIMAKYFQQYNVKNIA